LETGRGGWEKARDAGKFTKAHAGEFMGADFVRYVVEAIGVQRIERGIRSIEDQVVLDLLRERGIALDVCLISNLKLGVVPSASARPLRCLMDSGIACTISTDDPINFGNNIEDEYLFLANERGFSRNRLAQIAHNGFEVTRVD
jgi:adenosine deaminase